MGIHTSDKEALANGEVTAELIGGWREDPDGTYRSWFLWEERLKNFRSIRRGLEVVVAEIEAGTFGNLYKGCSGSAPTPAAPEEGSGQDYA